MRIILPILIILGGLGWVLMLVAYPWATFAGGLLLAGYVASKVANNS